MKYFLTIILFSSLYVNSISAKTLQDLWVLGIAEFRGEGPKCYPVEILNYHQIVNEDFDGVAFAVTYCPLTGANMLIQTDSLGGENFIGVTGNLFQSNLIFYDRNTESEWSQIRHTALKGNMIGKSLPFISHIFTKWQTWKTLYPNTTVLSRRTGFDEAYSLDPYPGYTASNRLIFPSCFETYHTILPYNLHSPKEHTLIVVIENSDRDYVQLYPYRSLKSYPVLNQNNSITKSPFVVVYDEKAFFCAAYSSLINGTRLTFSHLNGSDGDLMTFSDNQGTIWDIAGRAVSGPLKGSTLSRVSFFHAFWFAAISFFPDGDIFVDGELKSFQSPICPIRDSPPGECFVPCSSIINGGVEKDIIAALREPKFVSAERFEGLSRILWRDARPYYWLGLALCIVFLFLVVLSQMKGSYFKDPGTKTYFRDRFTVLEGDDLNSVQSSDVQMDIDFYVQSEDEVKEDKEDVSLDFNK